MGVGVIKNSFQKHLKIGVKAKIVRGGEGYRGCDYSASPPPPQIKILIVHLPVKYDFSKLIDSGNSTEIFLHDIYRL